MFNKNSPKNKEQRGEVFGLWVSRTYAAMAISTLGGTLGTGVCAWVNRDDINHMFEIRQQRSDTRKTILDTQESLAGAEEAAEKARAKARLAELEQKSKDLNAPVGLTPEQAWPYAVGGALLTLAGVARFGKSLLTLDQNIPAQSQTAINSRPPETPQVPKANNPHPG